MLQRNPIKGFLQIRRFIPLRYRFIILITGLLIIILGVLAMILGLHYRRTISKQMEGRGLAIAQSLAATATANFLTYNYVALEQSANQAAQAFDILYVIYHDKEGRVAGYSGRADLQNKSLKDKITQKALLAKEPIIQTDFDTSANMDKLDIAVPVYPHGVKERWGVVRVGLSLAPVHSQIRQMELYILTVGLMALVFGSLLSFWVARRITRPLDNLVDVSQRAAQGDLDSKIDIRTGDEVEVLATNFAAMIHKILVHRTQLECRFEQIQHLQRYTSQLLTTMSDGLMTVDMNGRIVTLNPAGRDMLAGPEYLISEDDDIDVLLPNFIDLHAYIQKLIEYPRDHPPEEVRFITAKEIKAFVVGAGILKDQDGRPLEIILNLHDITALEKLETSMRQAQILNQHKVLLLERENLQARYELLKSQLSPHFLFNTLSTLITLIEEDQVAAVHYVEELSRVYRYLLQTRDKKLVPLKTELNFVKSYAFLIKKRFGQNINITFAVTDIYYTHMIPPLSIQLLIENAVKHNIISSKKPLNIHVGVNHDNYLVVKNNLQKKRIFEAPTKVGLSNLAHRYEFFTDRQMVIHSDETHFVVKLPLLRRMKVEEN